MTRKPTVLTKKPPGEVVVSLSRVEALALATAAETGVKVIEALSLVKNTAAMEEALRKLRGAI